MPYHYRDAWPTMLVLHPDNPDWSTFVWGCSAASPFHHPAWTTLLAECYGYRPLALGLTDEAGRLEAGLPALEVSGPLGRRRWVSLPFTDYCPVLTRGRRVEDVARALVEEVKTRRLGAFELHAELPRQPGLHTRGAAVRHTLALSPRPSEVFSRFSSMHRRNIRRAERSGVAVSHGHSLRDVGVFYELHLSTRRRLGVPIQPRRFFRLLAQRIIAEELGFVLTAHVSGRPVAAAVFLTWNGTLIYKYGASDPRFWSYRPNNQLFWSAIRWGCENGYHTFDWGRADANDRGLRAFKEGWGAKEEPLSYSVVAATPPRRGSAGIERVLGTLIRRSPAWVCQALGEVLYGHAA